MNAQATSLEPARVLLVEDTPLLRSAFGRLLRLSGFEVFEAGDGRDALALVESFRPQVILTDLMMPNMDGYDLIRTIHDDPATSDVPILAITANSTEEAQCAARAAGATRVLLKPINLQDLLALLRDLGLNRVEMS